MRATQLPCHASGRTHTEEFYEITLFALPIAELNRDLQAWERT